MDPPPNTQQDEVTHQQVDQKRRKVFEAWWRPPALPNKEAHLSETTLALEKGGPNSHCPQEEKLDVGLVEHGQ